MDCNNVSTMDECRCSGCGLCAYVCPVNCISLVPNERGFLVPLVGDSCVQCGKCLLKCPSIHPPASEFLDLAFAARSVNDANLERATAGGMHLPISGSATRKGGVSYGAAFSGTWAVEHVRCCSEEEAAECVGSKYVQSSLISNDVFSSIAEDIASKTPVVFFGLPCQTAAVKKEFPSADDLVLVDLVCHGVASPMLWEAYLSEQRFGRIRDIRFRNKTYGYHMSTMRIQDEKGVYSKSGRVDPYLRAFFSGIAHRKACYACRFKGRRRYSDLTLFDCGSYRELAGKHDDDRGYTSVIVSTEKGMELVKSLDGSSALFEQVDRLKCERLHGKMIDLCTPSHSHGDDFYEAVRQRSLAFAAKKYLGIGFVDYAVEGAKSIAYRMGAMRILSALAETKRSNDKR
ncbi:Coenzyme F420 hydrogenase/dehydrogenase, beta subunit C-terminal domain [Adlercreutzia sp. ZJ242]|uniref:Coenzyme F420 hydrogenase/dehydrogenase, beta subunit C-terminal domain n=1 Tax=Adlercreutzia sp. ZJ242 TaxID=2709409 RepID=UPI0013EB4BAB|nr:Coenzyme F420 hydrogenase/dehydrogenase, beta subunit C-terminal domain [Adlercreutzia sp. ZJ242]